MDFTIKQGDTRTVLKATLINPSGNRVDLSGAEIQLVIADKNVPVLTKNGTIQDTLNGVVWVSFLANDFNNISGHLQGEIRVTFPDGKIETYPNDSYLKILVKKALK